MDDEESIYSYSSHYMTMTIYYIQLTSILIIHPSSHLNKIIHICIK